MYLKKMDIQNKRGDLLKNVDAWCMVRVSRSMYCVAVTYKCNEGTKE